MSQKRAKYGNKKTNGFASSKEARRAEELQLMEKADQIRDLRFQVPFELIPAQYQNGKLIERSCKYVADFVYYDRLGYMHVEDSKGLRTPLYVIKRKLMLKVHGIRIKEV